MNCWPAMGSHQFTEIRCPRNKSDSPGVRLGDFGILIANGRGRDNQGNALGDVLSPMAAIAIRSQAQQPRHGGIRSWIEVGVGPGHSRSTCVRDLRERAYADAADTDKVDEFMHKVIDSLDQYLT